MLAVVSSLAGCRESPTSSASPAPETAAPKAAVASPPSPTSSSAPAPLAAAETPSGVAAAPTPSAPGASAPAASGSAAVGLEAPDIDPELVALVKDVVSTCKFKGAEPAERCKAMDRYSEWLEDPVRKREAPLIKLLADKNERVRYLASVGLGNGLSPLTDPVLAVSLYTALEKERVPSVCPGMASAAAWVVTSKTGLDERGVKIAKGFPIPACRAAFVSHFLSANEDRFDLVVELAKTDKDAPVREAAASALRDGAGRNPARLRIACSTWVGLIDESGSQYAGRAAWLIATQSDHTFGAQACENEWDEMLKLVEAAAKAGKATAADMAHALAALHDQRKATAPQKSRALSVAKEIVGNTANGENSRAEALELIAKADPDARTFAEKFIGDEGAKVKKVAARIAQPAAPPASSK